MRRPTLGRSCYCALTPNSCSSFTRKCLAATRGGFILESLRVKWLEFIAINSKITLPPSSYFVWLRHKVQLLHKMPLFPIIFLPTASIRFARASSTLCWSNTILLRLCCRCLPVYESTLRQSQLLLVFPSQTREISTTNAQLVGNSSSKQKCTDTTP